MQALADRHRHRIEAGQGADSGDIAGDLVGMGKRVVGEQPRVAGELRQQCFELRRRADAIGVEEHAVERAVERRAQLRRVAFDHARAFLHARAPQVLARLAGLRSVALDRHQRLPAVSPGCAGQPYRAITVRRADLQNPPATTAGHQHVQQFRSRPLEVQQLVRTLRCSSVVFRAVGFRRPRQAFDFRREMNHRALRV